MDDRDDLELQDVRPETDETSGDDDEQDLGETIEDLPVQPRASPRKGKRRSKFISKRAEWMYEDVDKKPLEKNSASILSFSVRIVKRFFRKSPPRELLVDLENEKICLHKSQRYPVAGAHAVDCLASRSTAISRVSPQQAKKLTHKWERRAKIYLRRVRGGKHALVEFLSVAEKREFLELMANLVRVPDEVPRTTTEYKRRSAALSAAHEPETGVSDDDVWRGLALLSGEGAEKVFHSSTLFLEGDAIALSGVVTVSNYRLLFSKYKSAKDDVDPSGRLLVATTKTVGRRPRLVWPFLEAKHTEIKSIDFVNSANDDSLVHLTLRNGLRWSLGLGSRKMDKDDDDSECTTDHRARLRALWQKHRTAEFSAVHYNTYVFHKRDQTQAAKRFNGWDVYDGRSEYARVLGNVKGATRRERTSVFFNEDYALSSTYPSHFMVPTAFASAEELTHVAKFRSRERIPAVTWVHPSTGATLSRSSQPLPGVKGKRSPHDEALVRALETDENPGIYLVDARGVGAAFGNQIARGKGPENPSHYDDATLVFMGIGNIHSMRASFEKFTSCLQEPTLTPKSFHVRAANWLGHIRGLLSASTRVAEMLSLEGKSVLVHCSDGWDRTSQLTALASLVLDSYYRTLKGFVVLVEKEFLSFGFKFGDRHGFTPGVSEDEVSPIFLQFLEATNQLVRAHPNAFQFTPRVLVELALRSFDSRYGTFLDNTEKNRVRKRKHKTFSVWDDFLNDSSYLNRNYEKKESACWPDLRATKSAVWEEYFVDALTT